MCYGLTVIVSASKLTEDKGQQILLIIIRLVLEVSLSKVKCFVYCEMCEYSYNFLQ